MPNIETTKGKLEEIRNCCAVLRRHIRAEGLLRIIAEIEKRCEAP